MAKVFRDYTEVNEKLMEGFTVANAYTGINSKDTGMVMELERQIDNVVIGVNVSYDPDNEDGEPELAISDEYVKRIIQ